jgi:cytochrome b561
VKTATAYHPVVVAMHWLLALLIVAELSLGLLAFIAASETQRIALLRWHFPLGVLIALLMIVRLGVRLLTASPAPADALSRWKHFGIYALVLLVTAVGFATAVLNDLGAVVFGAKGGALPAGLATYPTMIAHAALAALLAFAIAAHVVAVILNRARFGTPVRAMSFARRAVT